MAGKEVALGGGAVAVVAALAALWWMQANPERAGDTAEPVALASAPDPAASAPVESAAQSDAPEATLMPDAPRFDVVRVDVAGLATIAGLAPPDAVVVALLDGEEVGRGKADGLGQFAMILTLPPSSQPRLMSLRAELPDGQVIAGLETVAIGPISPPVLAQVADPQVQTQLAEQTAAAQEQAEVATELVSEPAPMAAPEAEAVAVEEPRVLVAVDPVAPPPALLIGQDGAKVLQGTGLAPEMPDLPVSIDTISYDAAGQVLLNGRAGAGGALRIYLDTSPVADVVAGADGAWRAALADVPAGLHSLRVDQIGPDGKVVSRYETPFKRDIPLQVAVAQAEGAVAPVEPNTDANADQAPSVAPAPITITVQPGLTLWAIARENFGEGVMYVQVFEANRDKIKDPDLIYPGQVFTVPKP